MAVLTKLDGVSQLLDENDVPLTDDIDSGTGGGGTPGVGESQGLLLALTFTPEVIGSGTPIGLLLAITGASSSLPVTVYQLTGQDVSFHTNTILTATTRSYTLTTGPAPFIFNFLNTALITSPQVVIGNGTPLGLLLSLTTNDSTTLTDTFDYTHVPALDLATKLVTQVTPFTFTGNDAQLLVGGTDTVMLADRASFTLVGKDVSFLYAVTMPTTVQTYTLTGVSANLVYAVFMPAVVRSYALTGISSILRVSAATSPVSFGLLGPSNTLTPALVATSRTYALTGITPVLNRALVADTRAYIETGKDVNLNPTGLPVPPYSYGIIF